MVKDDTQTQAGFAAQSAASALWTDRAASAPALGRRASTTWLDWSLCLCFALTILPLLSLSVQADQWAARRTVGPFEVRSEFKLDDTAAKKLVAEISRLQSDVEHKLGITASDDPIELNLFKSKASYHDYVALRIPEGASRPALFVKGTDRARVYVYRRKGYEVDVRHECTHAVLHNVFPYVPLWLDEGFAEYFEAAPADRLSHNSHQASLTKSIKVGWKPNLLALEQKKDLSSMGSEEYRESWAWVHFMLHGPPPARQTLSDFLYDIREGYPAGKLSERLVANGINLNTELLNHFRHWKQ